MHALSVITFQWRINGCLIDWLIHAACSLLYLFLWESTTIVLLCCLYACTRERTFLDSKIRKQKITNYFYNALLVALVKHANRFVRYANNFFLSGAWKNRIGLFAALRTVPSSGTAPYHRSCHKHQNSEDDYRLMNFAKCTGLTNRANCIIHHGCSRLPVRYYVLCDTN